MSIKKRLSELGLIMRPVTAQTGIKIDATVIDTPLFLLKSDARNIRKPKAGTINNVESISSLLVDG